MGLRTTFSPMGSGKKCFYTPNQSLLETDTPRASGTIEIKCSHWFWLQICGAGASSCQQKHQNAASGGSGAGFMGRIFLKKGLYNWYVGCYGGKNADQNGEASYFYSADGSYGLICGGGTRNGNSYGVPPPGGTLTVLGDVQVKDVLFMGNGNPGGAAIYGGWQAYQSPSVFAAITGEIYGQGGQGANANAKQGVIRLFYK